jgi:hypothetical protein
MKFLLALVILFSAASSMGQCVSNASQTCTPTLNLYLPFHGSYQDDWEIPYNNNSSLLDQVLSGNGLVPLALKPVYNLNSIQYIDGVHYAFNDVGVGNAIAAASIFGGVVVFPPTGQLSGTSIVFSSGSITLPSNVCLVGAGRPWATILEFTAPNATGITLNSGTQKACVENLSVEIDTSATGATGIQIGNGGAGITSFNTIDNVGIKCQGQNVSGQSGLFLLGQTSTTNVNLNKINVFI